MDSDSDVQTLYTLQDVANHNKDGDLWVVIDGKVYDLTTYLDTHPGGKQGMLLSLSVLRLYFIVFFAILNLIY